MSYTLSDIVRINTWQKIQDYFSTTLSVYLHTVDPAFQALTHPSGSPRLYNMIHRITGRKKMLCAECVLGEFENIEKDWTQGYECVDGIFMYPVPLRVQNDTLAYLIVGPVIVGRTRSYQSFKDVIDVFGVDQDEFVDALKDTRTFTFNGVRPLLGLFSDIGRYVCEVGYTHLRLRRLLPSTSSLFDSLNEICLEGILKALLDISCNLLHAERGSIMLLNKTNEELYIAFANGISQEVINSTRQGLSQGIAGFVASNRQPMIIDPYLKDEKIRSLLCNPQLTYSISVPLQVKSKLLGVLNVATTKSEAKEFAATSIETINTLTQLVEEAFSDIPSH